MISQNHLFKKTGTNNYMIFNNEFDLAGIEMELEKALKRKVDLLTYNSIHHLLKDRILR